MSAHAMLDELRARDERDADEGNVFSCERCRFARGETFFRCAWVCPTCERALVEEIEREIGVRI